MKLLVLGLVFCYFSSATAVITYQLYTRSNLKNGQPLIYKNAKSITSSYFNSAKKYKMILHGYNQNGRSDMNKELKDALLAHDDYNVIVVDWSTASGSNYNAAIKNMKAIGKSIAQFIDWLKLDKGYLHLIGFDLGAHVAGLTGKQTSLGRIDKITGLDPNREGININQSINRLAAGDARFVEVYHSNRGRIGIQEHVVDSDKYINWGIEQPGCTSDECAHYYSVKVYVAQVNGAVYPIYTCESLSELDGQGCGWLESEWTNEVTGITQIDTRGIVEGGEDEVQME